MEAFARRCPNTPAGARARELVAEKAFLAWRRLPWNFSPEFGSRLLAIWQTLAPNPRIEALGGRGFQLAARFLGPARAGALFRRWQGSDYAASRTMSDGEVAALLAKLPR
jgi:hypothetical protein